MFWGATPTRSLKEDLWVRYQVTTSALRREQALRIPLSTWPAGRLHP